MSKSVRNSLILAGLWMLVGTGCELLGDSDGGGARNPDRKRPSIQGNRLLSDKGTLLRGVRYALDYGQELPPKATIMGLSQTYGLNALHIYLEKYDNVTGENAAKADSLVEWASQAGLYVIVTIGCGDRNGRFDTAQARAFWNFYAPRYADRTHVIYEIHNEPEFTCLASYTDSTIRFEKEMYELIRSKAPKTMQLLFTYSNIPHASNALKDIRKLDSVVDWSNAAVAYHGYYWCGKRKEEIDTIGTIVDAGYAVINTEFEDDVGWAYDAVRYEKLGIGWMNFQYLIDSRSDLVGFRKDAELFGLSWVPDQGVWPQSSLGTLPYQKVP